MTNEYEYSSQYMRLGISLIGYDSVPLDLVELRADVMTALKTLPLAQQFALRALAEGYTYQEIATALGKKQRMYGARVVAAAEKALLAALNGGENGRNYVPAAGNADSKVA